jgi:hypothetical protein
MKNRMKLDSFVAAITTPARASVMPDVVVNGLQSK